MKLRKALERARREKKQRSVVTSIKRPVVVKKSPEKKWKPPVYDESVQALADPDLVRENRYVCIDQMAPEIEFYKVLRTRIQQKTGGNNRNAIMITSPMSSEGKTTTAVNLSFTFAKAYNQTVLLIDGDLRRQGIHRLLGVDSDKGLVDYLVSDQPLKNFIIWPGVKQMTLISGGQTIQNSAELLGSERMKALVQEMKKRYSDRYLIFDAPPVLLGADALTLSPLVDGIVMVVEEGKTRMRDIRKAVAMLPREKMLGFVMNRQSMPREKYYY
jgi:non-specific protein-tyrosine kinase